LEPIVASDHGRRVAGDEVVLARVEGCAVDPDHALTLERGEGVDLVSLEIARPVSRLPASAAQLVLDAEGCQVEAAAPTPPSSSSGPRTTTSSCRAVRPSRRCATLQQIVREEADVGLEPQPAGARTRLVVVATGFGPADDASQDEGEGDRSSHAVR
jgi:hypothetical protein